MKKLFIILFLFIIFTASGQSGEVSIIPQPVQILEGKGSFKFKAGTTISYNNTSVKEVAEMLAVKLNHATGFTIKAAAGEKGKIQFNINTGKNNFSPEYTEPFEIPSVGPVTLRVIAYRDEKPLGHLITLKPEDLKN